ncbi:Endo-1,4-beta-xylanase A precursor [Pelotomaculum schinkii]|uniref:Endo-1,4-beta-xylanase A n=1 Tax=Pelotomaculum schinkii TaxID=78350 RepID=A0A4Y7RHB7_9FIRM|nr:Ig-like domain-containing protein [Pelotomaculum schinkii]TEB08384.1 Endo-1,4-beta-xylanase A precursor [Pelotomaculum schinkii]
MFKKVLMVLLALVMVLGFATASQAAPWKDKNNKKFFVKKNYKPVTVTDIGSHWAKQPIEVMASYGIILGYPDQTFRPNSSVSVNEAIMMISRAAGFEVSTATSGQSSYDGFPFWMQDCIDFALDEGIIEESELDDLNGNQAAKRYQVAVWASRAMGLEVDDRLAFEDTDEIPFYARPYVGGMCANSYMIGYPGNIFQPNKAVTRAELAMVLYRIMLAEDNGSDNDDNSLDLQLVTLSPRNGSYSIDADTYQLTAKFNEDIRAVEDLDDVMDGIAVRNITDGKYVDIDTVAISGSTLTITLEDSLEQGQTYRVTISSGIIESEESGENFTGLSGSNWQFATGDDDVSDLEIESLNPRKGSDSVDPDTNELTVEFNEDICAVEDLDDVMDGISVRNITDGRYIDIDTVAISGSTLTITLEDSLEQGKTYRVAISSGIIESEDSGENFVGISGSEWQFTTVDSFYIEKLTPRNGAADVDLTDVLKASFSGDISAVSGKSLLGAVRVYNKTDGVYVDIDKVEIDGDTLTITLEDTLEGDSTFEVTIKAGYLEDEDTGADFAGLNGSDWRFTTE